MLIFGNQTHFAVDPLRPQGSALGSCAYYTHPSFESFYSNHGFTISIDSNIIPYADLLNAGQIDFPAHIGYTESTHSYFRVTRNGMLGLPMVTRHRDSTISLGTRPIIPQKQGWWIAEPFEDEADETKRMLLGFLHTDPSREAIDAWLRKRIFNKTFEWFAIADVVKKINDDFPLPSR